MTDVTALLSGPAGLYCTFGQLEEPDSDKNLGGEKSRPGLGRGAAGGAGAELALGGEDPGTVLQGLWDLFSELGRGATSLSARLLTLKRIKRTNESKPVSERLS